MRFIFLVSVIVYSINMQAQTWIDQTCPIQNEMIASDITNASKNDLLNIVINQEGKVIVNNKDLSFLNDTKFKEFIYTFITNPDDSKERASSPKKATIQINHYSHPQEYDTYLTYIREVYYFIWNTASQEKYNLVYNDLDCKQREKIQKPAPYRVFEVSKASKKDKPKRPQFNGPPPFNGDVKDN